MKSVFQLISHYITKHRKVIHFPGIHFPGIHFPKGNYFPAHKRGLNLTVTNNRYCSILSNNQPINLVIPSSRLITRINLKLFITLPNYFLHFGSHNMMFKTYILTFQYLIHLPWILTIHKQHSQVILFQMCSSTHTHKYFKFSNPNDVQ